MSQVRKLKNGKLIINDVTYEATPEMLQELHSQISAERPEYQQFLGDVSNALSQGRTISVNTHLNQITGLDGFTALSKKQNEVLSKGRSRAGKYWDAITGNNKQLANEAIYKLGRYTFSPAKEETKKTPAKTKVSNDLVDFDYDTREDGTKFLSENPINNHIRERFRYYYDWLDEPDTWNNVYEWSAAPLNEAVLKSYWNSLEGDNTAKRQALEARVNQALENVKNANGWENVDEATREFLEYFNIGKNPKSATTPSAGVRSGYRTEDGKVDATARRDDGSYYVWRGNKDDGEDVNGYYTNFAWQNQDTPYIITESDWNKLGLNGEFEGLRNGVLLNGRIYTPEQIAALTGSDLYETMEQIRVYNADKNLSGAARWAAIGKLADWAGEGSDYTAWDWDPSKSYFIDPAWLSGHWYNKDNNYSFYDASSEYGQKAGSILGVINSGSETSNPWGFRTPFYLYKDAQGNIQVLNNNEDFTALGFNYNPYANIAGFDPNNFFRSYDPQYPGYGVYKDVTDNRNADTTYRILEKNGSLYIINSKGKLIPVSDALKAKIDRGERISSGERESGKAEGEGKAQKKSNANGGGQGGGTREGSKKGALVYQGQSSGAVARRGMKNGGKLEYISKLQRGRNVPTPVELNAPEEYTNSQAAISLQKDGQWTSFGDLWKDMSPADKNDVRAAILDLAGAGIGFAGPVGSVAGAGLGLTSTGLMVASDIERGRAGWTTAGNAALATGLDIASVIPFFGESAKLAKATKSLTKAARILGPMFASMGLINASGSLKKLVTDPKNFNSEDLLAISGGLQALMGVGHRTVKAAQDSRLAAKISDVKRTGNTPKGTDPSGMKRKMRTTEVDSSGKKIEKDINLTVDQVEKVTNGTSDDPATRLKEILIQEHKVDPTSFTNTNDKALLESFGFKVNEKGIWKGKIKNRHDVTGASASKPSSENYSKRGYLTHLGGGVKRQAYIDSNLANENVRKAVESSFEATEASGEGVSSALKHAYTRAQRRQYVAGLNRGHQWKELPKEDQYFGKSQTEARAAARQTTPSTPESNPIPPTSTTPTPTPVPTSAPITPPATTPVAPTPAPVAPVTPSTPTAPTVPVVPESPITAGSETVSRSSKKIRANERSIRDIKKNKRIAANIEKLRKSANPMKTLRELNDSERDFDKQVFESKEFREALDEALANMKGPNKHPNSPYRKYLQKFMDDSGLFFKQGGVLKGDNGLPGVYSIYDNLSLFPEGTEPTIKKYNVDALGDLYPQLRSAPKLTLKTPTWRIPGTNQEISLGNPTQKTYGYVHSQRPSLSYGLVDSGLGWYQYLSDIKDINKYTKNQIDAINASRYQELSPRIELLDEHNPVLDRARAEINQRIMTGTKAGTSDQTRNAAEKLARDASSINELNQNTAAQSQDTFQRQQTNIDRTNQQKLQDATTANANRRINATLDSAIFNAQNEAILRKQQSRENKLLELRNQLEKDHQTALSLDREAYADQLQRGMEDEWKKEYGSQWAEWEKLGSAGQMDYTDFEEYVRKKYADDYNGVYFDNLRKDMRTLMTEWYRQNGLRYPGFNRLMSRTDNGGIDFPIFKKKGGYLRGTTRYTKEPDEQIWIDNNKAAHKAIAKLDDNILKLILKALK